MKKKLIKHREAYLNMNLMHNLIMTVKNRMKKLIYMKFKN